MSQIATNPLKTKGRLVKEVESPFRSPYQRDRDRIIHSAAFRRLEYKTQVFVNHEGDHYRTRLTHSLEVSQIARTLAHTLNLDVHLTEAIALSHDLGHTPFGHAGEDALKEVYPDFDHNAQTIKILTKLEQRYAEFDGLNLSWETLDGIAKHNGPLNNPPREIREFNKIWDLELDKFSSLEAQIASLADDIAYISHDVDDGLRAGLFRVDDILHLPIVGESFCEVLAKYPKIEAPRLIHESHRRILNIMVQDLYEETLARIKSLGIKTADDARNCKESVATFSAKILPQVREVKSWLMENMYRHYKVNRMTSKARRVVVDLYNFFMAEPECLPTEWQARAKKIELKEVVADYIAGMTDRFAIQEYEKIFKIGG